MSIQKLVAAAACALAFGTHAHAAATLLTATERFFAESATPGNVTVPQNVITERNRFLGQLATGAGAYGFEPLRLNDVAPLQVVFSNGIIDGDVNPITATLTGNGKIQTSPVAGRFNTTPGGSRYWEVMSGPTGGFTITFDRAVSAFGFYGTDIGDFGGDMTLFLTPDDNGPIEEFTIDVSATTNGGLFFWGFASRLNAYKSIRFQTNDTSTNINDADFFGFDDFIVADLAPLAGPGAAPEPGSLALAGLALLGMGAARRRNRG